MCESLITYERGTIKMYYIKRTFMIYVILFTQLAYSADTKNNFWLGKLDLVPAATNYSRGALYYDKTASRLKVLAEINQKQSWEDVPGESSYETIVTVSEADNAGFLGEKTAKDCIKSSLEAFASPSEKNRCALIILPGTYELKSNSINCREYVDIIGIRGSSVVKSSGETTLLPANNCGIIGLTLNNSGVPKKASCVKFEKIASFSFISDCEITSKHTALKSVDSPFINVTDCLITSTDGSAISLNKSEATLFNSTVSAKNYALECLGASKATLYNSVVPGIFISKDSFVELNKCDTKMMSIKGEKKSTVLISSSTVNIPVSPGVTVQKPRQLSRMKVADNTSRTRDSGPPRDEKKECPCKKKQQPAIAIEPEFAYKKIFKEKTGIVLVDARSEDSYEEKHIKTAINIPSSKIMESLSLMPKEKEIIVYCSILKCSLSEEFVRTLQYLGYTNTGYIKGGLEDWEKRGYPVTGKKP